MAKQPEINLDALMRGDAAGIQPWIEEEDEKKASSNDLRAQIAEIILEKEELMREGANADDENHKRFHHLSEQLEPIVNRFLGQYPDALNNAGYLELSYIIKHTNSLTAPEASEKLEAIAQKYVNEYSQGKKREELVAPHQIKAMKKFIDQHSANQSIATKANEQLAKEEKEVFQRKIFQNRTPIFSQEANVSKYPALQPETYTKEDIKKLMDEYNQFIVATPKNEDKDKFNNEFEQTVIGGTKDVEDFATGLLSAEPDALDAMEDYINLFGKEYIDKKYVLTPAAEKALARIKDLRQKARQDAEKTASQKQDIEKAKLAKIKEISKKKPQDISLQDYLLLKQVIEENPRKTPEQKAKDIESLTSKARIRMKNPSTVRNEELPVAPAFIAAFGYDKDAAINKDAMYFRDAVAKKTPVQQSNVQDKPVKVAKPQSISKTTSKKDKKPKGIIAWFKNAARKTAEWIKRNPAPIIVGLIAGSSLLGMRGCSNDDDKNKKTDNIEVLAKTYEGGQLPEVVITPEKADVNLLKQYAKRIGHQEKLSPEAASKRSVRDLIAFQKLPDEMKAKFAGQSDEEKLARLGVVRGDQDKLHQPIDDLLAGKKINPLTLKDISERSFKVTDDFGAHKDNSLKNGPQSIQMSAYQIQKALQDKGIDGK